jgi:hypothetical protein
VSDDSAWLKFIVSEIAEAAPWENKSAPHAAAHVRNLILNLKTEANVQRKLYEHAMETVTDMVRRCNMGCDKNSYCGTCGIAISRYPDLEL